MREAVVCSPLRTPIGRYGGQFRDVPASALATRVIEALIERTGLDPATVEDVIFGQHYAKARRQRSAGWRPLTPVYRFTSPVSARPPMWIGHPGDSYCRDVRADSNI